MLGYDTSAFLRLRAAVKSDTAMLPHVPQATATALKGLRDRAMVLFGAGSSDTGPNRIVFRELFCATWKQLAELDEFTNPFALPPAYETPDLSNHISWAANVLYSLERGIRAIGDNAIFAGSKGTGKTTMLQVTGAVAAVLLQSTMPIYWSFETEAKLTPTIGQLLQAATRLRSSAAEDVTMQKAVEAVGDALSLEAALAEFGHAVAGEEVKSHPLLLIDEFTTLYFADYPASAAGASGGAGAGAGADYDGMRAHGRAIMNELRQFAKMHTNVAVLLAASTTCVERYMHPESRDFRGYPNLNNSVYIRRDMIPIRDPATLAAYAATRYPGWVVDGARLLDATGGIGRFVANLRTNTSWRPDFKVEDVICSHALFDLCCAMLSYIPARFLCGASDPWPAGFGIGLADAVTLLGKHGIVDGAASSLIDKWCDALVFHRSGGFLEFLIPANARELHQALGADDELNMARVLSMTLHGFHGGDPGHSNEDLICKYIHRHVGVGGSTDNVLRLRPPAGAGAAPGAVPDTVPGAGAAAAPAPGAAADPAAEWVQPSGDVTPAVLADMLSTVMKWRTGGIEKGIDRIWLTNLGPHPTSGQQRVQIDGLQLKTGKHDRKVTAGILASQRRCDSMARIDDNTIAGILVKAERGLAAVLPALHCAFPDVTFVLGEIRIYSTKPLDEAAASFRSANPLEADTFRIRELEAGQIRASGAVDAALPVQFSWTTHGGTEWLHDILPPRVAALVKLA